MEVPILYLLRGRDRRSVGRIYFQSIGCCGAGSSFGTRNCSGNNSKQLDYWDHHDVDDSRGHIGWYSADCRSLVQNGSIYGGDLFCFCVDNYHSVFWKYSGGVSTHLCGCLYWQCRIGRGRGFGDHYWRKKVLIFQ